MKKKPKARRPGWQLNKEFFIADGKRLRRADIRNQQDAAAIREYLARAARR